MMRYTKEETRFEEKTIYSLSRRKMTFKDISNIKHRNSKLNKPEYLDMDINDKTKFEVCKRSNQSMNIEKETILTRNSYKLNYSTNLIINENSSFTKCSLNCHYQLRSIKQNRSENKFLIQNYYGQNHVNEPYKKYKDNLYMCYDYVKDIYDYLYESENTFLIKKNFIQDMEISPGKRALLIDWMINLQCLFKMTNESLHSSIYLLDTYIGKNRDTELNELHILAIACLSIAGKYEEVRAPRLKEFVKATRNKYRIKDLAAMEIKVLKTVGMRLNKPGIMCFLRRYSIVANMDKMHHCLGKFFADISLLNYDICYRKSSHIAATATFLSLCLRTRIPDASIWDANFVKYSRYNFNSILQILKYLIPFIIDLPHKEYSSSIMDKYAMDTFENVINKVYSKKNLQVMKLLAVKYLK